MDPKLVAAAFGTNAMLLGDHAPEARGAFGGIMVFMVFSSADTVIVVSGGIAVGELSGVAVPAAGYVIAAEPRGCGGRAGLTRCASRRW